MEYNIRNKDPTLGNIYKKKLENFYDKLKVRQFISYILFYILYINHNINHNINIFIGYFIININYERLNDYKYEL